MSCIQMKSQPNSGMWGFPKMSEQSSMATHTHQTAMHVKTSKDSLTNGCLKLQCYGLLMLKSFSCCQEWEANGPTCDQNLHYLAWSCTKISVLKIFTIKPVKTIDLLDCTLYGQTLWEAPCFCGFCAQISLAMLHLMCVYCFDENGSLIDASHLGNKTKTCKIQKLYLGTVQDSFTQSVTNHIW